MGSGIGGHCRFGRNGLRSRVHRSTLNQTLLLIILASGCPWLVIMSASLSRTLPYQEKASRNLCKLCKLSWLSK